MSKEKFKEEENRWVRGWVYWQRGLTKEKALERADKEIEEMKEEDMIRGLNLEIRDLALDLQDCMERERRRERG